MSAKHDRTSFRSKGSLTGAMISYVFIIIIAAGLLTYAGLSLMKWLGIFSKNFEGLIFMALFIIVSAILGTVISFLVARHVLAPIEELKSAISEVEHGNFNVSVNDFDAPGTVNELIKSFNKMTAELSGIEMFRSDFINSFSHEFKTPIVSIEGFARRLKKEDLPEEKRREYIDIIISESKRLTKLSSNILMLNKLENQQIITDRDTFRLDEQIRSCILLLEKQWTKKDISFDIDIEEINFFGNQEMLSQVWLNVIGNSIKFSPEGSVITVSGHMREDRIRISIKDTGEGMDEQTLGHIFERFYQGDSAHSSEGNGLGLPLVKRIIELCGGTIRVESQKDRGTVFTVFFNTNK